MQKKVFLLLLSVLYFVAGKAQQEESIIDYRKRIKEEFYDYRKQLKTEFEQYRMQRNLEFARYIENKWEPFKEQPQKQQPLRPEPIKPIVYKKTDFSIPSKQLLDVNISPLPNIPQDIPLTLVPLDEKNEDKLHSFLFYGQTCKIRAIKDYEFSVNGLSEKQIAKAWRILSAENYIPLINDCTRLRSELRLCDWAYVELLEKVTGNIVTPSSNEQILLQAYLLIQTGFDARLCKKNEKLALLIHTDGMIYGYGYIIIDEKKYFQVSNQTVGGTILTYKNSFSDKSIPIRLAVNKIPNFKGESIHEKYTINHSRLALNFTVSVNKGLMQFYSNYPQCDWVNYVRTPLTKEFKQQVVQNLHVLVAGKTKLQALENILSFVQQCFTYQTDEDQFGKERVFFVDENFYYAANDCEDRAILFATLVKEMLHLDVVFLHYPNHLATAVGLDNSVAGDYIVCNGRKYIVCDPTYIGAPAGQTMSQFKAIKPQVLPCIIAH